MKKTVKYLSLILIFLLSANMLCACTKPWTYTDSVWYSEEPSIQIYKEDDGNWYIDVTKDGNTEKYLFLWSGTMGVSICPLNREEDSNNIRLFRGKIDKFNSKKFVVKVREDKIWNYEYIVITKRRMTM